MTSQKQIVPFDPASADDRRLVAEHVEKVLASPLFRLSRRLPLFLQFVVNLAVEGSDNAPKERTLGIEVFGRRPDYDTNADPVVRMTATELRKKLAQYYHTDGRDDLIEIELPPGSYLPRIRRLAPISETPIAEAPPPVDPVTLPSVAATVAGPLPISLPAESFPALPTALPEPPLAPAGALGESTSPASMWRYVAFASAALLFVTLLALVWALRRGSSPTTAFWHGFAGSSESVTIVMPVIGKLQTDAITPPSVQAPATTTAQPGAQSGGQPGAQTTTQPAVPPVHVTDISVAPNLSLEDTTIAARVAGQLERNNLGYFITSSREINFAQLRTGPAILIGALDNEWTMRLGQELPFGFEQSADGHTGRIVEHSPGGEHGSGQLHSWSINISTPHRRIGQDFGIVASFRSRLTGERVLVVAGISSQGTQAAGELLTSPDMLKRLLGTVRGAENFEWVIQTEAVEGRAGPPQIVASRTW